MKAFNHCRLYINSKNYENILADTNIIRWINHTISCISSTDVPVLIIGEQGTCKVLLAKIIHENSNRKRGKFISANIENTDKNVLETELFGHDYIDSCHQKLRKIGKFEQANGGTILLDEIGKMPVDLQSKLIRIIEEQKIHHIEKNKSIAIDARIISTTSENLDISIKEKRVREDLYYRISAFPIFIPPLRELRDDIKILVNRFFKIAIKHSDKLIYGISNEAMKALIDYDWPGNIYELENAIKSAVKLETSKTLQKSSLPNNITNNKKQILKNTFIDSSRSPFEILPLNEVEKMALINAMKITGNNVQLVAKALGINRATVYRKLEKYQLLTK